MIERGHIWNAAWEDVQLCVILGFWGCLMLWQAVSDP